MWNQGKWASAFPNCSYEVMTGRGGWKIEDRRNVETKSEKDNFLR